MGKTVKRADIIARAFADRSICKEEDGDRPECQLLDMSEKVLDRVNCSSPRGFRFNRNKARTKFSTLKVVCIASKRKEKLLWYFYVENGKKLFSLLRILTSLEFSLQMKLFSANEVKMNTHVGGLEFRFVHFGNLPLYSLFS